MVPIRLFRGLDHSAKITCSTVEVKMAEVMEVEGGVSAESLKEHLVAKLNNLCWQLQHGGLDDYPDDAINVIDLIIEGTSFLDLIAKVPEEVYSHISQARRIMEQSCSVSKRVPLTQTSIRGRPSYDLPEKQLASLIELGFSVPQMSNMLQISKRTIQRRLAQYQLSSKSWSEISDEELDKVVADVKLYNPNCGSKNLSGYVLARGIKVSRERIRDSLRRVDPIGVLVRRINAIHRRSYMVSRPLALWHLDGNHKLIRWSFVVHGCIDGYTRIPVFLKCSTNNMAATVAANFLGATEQWGIPSRIRCDRGGENVDVVRFMLETRGTGRKSALVGRSVHNQRIERLWRDVFKDVLHLFYDLFYALENVGVLDILDELDLWSLHFSFLELIDQKLTEWVKAWTRHPLSSMGNHSPLQLWAIGLIDNCDLTVSDEYGIDWHGPISNDDDRNTLNLDNVECPLQANQLEDLQKTLNECGLFSSNLTPWMALQRYMLVKEFVHSHGQQ